MVIYDMMPAVNSFLCPVVKVSSAGSRIMGLWDIHRAMKET